LVEVDEKYIKKCSQFMKTDIRKKSRKGKTDNEANFRIDLDMGLVEYVGEEV